MRLHPLLLAGVAVIAGPSLSQAATIADPSSVTFNIQYSLTDADSSGGVTPGDSITILPYGILSGDALTGSGVGTFAGASFSNTLVTNFADDIFYIPTSSDTLPSTTLNDAPQFQFTYAGNTYTFDFAGTTGTTGTYTGSTRNFTLEGYIDITAAGFTTALGSYTLNGTIGGSSESGTGSLTIAYPASVPTVPTVPLPATLPLAMAGLAGLGFMGLRRRAAA